MIELNGIVIYLLTRIQELFKIKIASIDLLN